MRAQRNTRKCLKRCQREAMYSHSYSHTPVAPGSEMGSDTSSKLSALISPVGRDLSRHWRFTGLAGAIAQGASSSESDRVALEGQKTAGNVPPECDRIEWIVVGKAA